MEETLGIPAKHLQCAAVQVLALNFRLVSLVSGNSEAQWDRVLLRLITTYVTAGLEKACS